MDSVPEKIVYLVRHGESNDNTAPVFQSTNSPLSPKGRQQAVLLADRISNVDFDKLVSSPLPRAKQTAEAISKVTGNDIEYSSLFAERIKPSSIDGKPYTDKKASKVWRQSERSLVAEDMSVEDGENYSSILNRADKALNYLLELQASSIVVITHGYFLRTIVTRVLLAKAITPTSFKNLQIAARITNTGVTVLSFEDEFEQSSRWRLKTYNDQAHLAE